MLPQRHLVARKSHFLYCAEAQTFASSLTIYKKQIILAATKNWCCGLKLWLDVNLKCLVYVISLDSNFFKNINKKHVFELRRNNTSDTYILSNDAASKIQVFIGRRHSKIIRNLASVFLLDLFLIIVFCAWKIWPLSCNINALTCNVWFSRLGSVQWLYL